MPCSRWITSSLRVLALLPLTALPGCSDDGSEGGSAADAASSGDPFAEKANVPRGLGQDNIDVLTLEHSEVPGKSEVGQPSYPDARVVRTVSASRGKVDGASVNTLPAIYMLSNDGADEVLDFYKKALEDWNYEEISGPVHVFWPGEKGEKGEKDGDPVKITARRESPFISVKPATENSLMPDARTRIEITYEPKK